MRGVAYGFAFLWGVAIAARLALWALGGRGLVGIIVGLAAGAILGHRAGRHEGRRDEQDRLAREYWKARREAVERRGGFDVIEGGG